MTSVNTRIESSPWSIFLIFLRLGLTSFGGPVAHLGYFHHEFVTRRAWLSERSYVDLVALCQFLPGPASSQVGIAIGLSRGRYAGAIAAWAGFTLPSAIALILFAQGLSMYGDGLGAGALHGLKVVAVAVVAQAVWSMARTLCPDAPRITIMAIAACICLLIPSAWAQVGTLAVAALAGLIMFKPPTDNVHDPLPIAISRRTGMISLSLFVLLLGGLPILAQIMPNQTIAVIDAFFRAGSLVFGGGHVVLPLLQAEVVPAGWISNETFLSGYGAAQAVPGPLFTFASFVGASLSGAVHGWMGGMICLIAIFAPSFLLVVGVLPFWDQVRRNTRSRAALTGINAAVVGLLLAALYQPVWTGAIHEPSDFALGLAAFIALVYWKLPPWLVVLACAVAGWILSRAA